MSDQPSANPCCAATQRQVEALKEENARLMADCALWSAAMQEQDRKDAERHAARMSQIEDLQTRLATAVQMFDVTRHRICDRLGMPRSSSWHAIESALASPSEPSPGGAHEVFCALPPGHPPPCVDAFGGVLGGTRRGSNG